MPISIKLDYDALLKIDPNTLFQGKKCRWLDLKLVETKGNQYGDDYFCTQALKRNADGTWPKGPILGNARVLGQGAPQQQRQDQHPDDPSKSPYEQRREAPKAPPADDSVPF
jgi:hypothetical protein